MTLYEILKTATNIHDIKMLSFCPKGAIVRATGEVLEKDSYIESTLATASHAIKHMRHLYGDRTFITHENDIVADFVQTFNDYMSEREIDFGYIASNLLLITDKSAYNPIENYNRNEVITDTTTVNGTTTTNNSEVNTGAVVSGSTVNNHSETVGDSTDTIGTTNKENSYNETEVVTATTDTSNTNENSSTISSNSDVTSNTENVTNTMQDKTETVGNTTTFEHVNKTMGNIGVMSTQQMLEQQFAIFDRGAILDIVLMPFIDEFTIYE